MSDQDAEIRRARRAFQEALASDGVEHPGYEAIEAYVDGTLDPAERARIEQLAEQSSAVAEDIADLDAVRRAIGDHKTPVRVRRNIPWAGVAAAAAAGFVAAVWIGVMRNEPAPAPTAGGTVAAPASMFAGSNLSNEERTAVENAVATGTLNVPAAVVALNTKRGTLLGAGESRNPFNPVTPIATAVLSTRPTFEWSAADADRYTITVVDDTFTEVARGARVSGTSWTPSIDLPRGATYRWQVTAHRAAGDVTIPAPPQPEARFSIVDAPTAEAVRGQRERLSQSPLALGVLMADAGLLIDARAELQRAIEIPATADAAKKLLDAISPTISRDQGTPTTMKPAQ
jgi:hypothetical protein